MKAVRNLAAVPTLDLTFEAAVQQIHALLGGESDTHWKIGQLYNYIVDNKLAEMNGGKEAYVVNGFTGSSIWHLVYSFPPVLPGQHRRADAAPLNNTDGHFRLPVSSPSRFSACLIRSASVSLAISSRYNSIALARSFNCLS